MSENLAHNSTLTKLAKQINERESVIEQTKTKTIDAAGIALTEMILQGQDLIAAKANVPHGLWLDWLKSHCPKSVCTAQRYMSVAQRCRKQEITAGEGLRTFIQLSFIDEPSDEKPKQWPPFYEAYCRIAKVCRYVERHPAQEWPEEIREKAKEDLLPLAKILWADRFE